jgi:Spy/CpxP family protein refolding chaperone
MKPLLLSGALCAAFLFTVSHSAPAQTGPAPDRSRGAWQKPGKSGGSPSLSADERQRLAAARERAKNDPTVRSLEQARQAIDDQLENAMNAAMVAADPALAPTLEKVKTSRERAKGMGDWFRSLSPEQREQLKAAQQKAMQDPEVIAAREKMKSAESPEARRQASEAMRTAVKAAVAKENPELVPLLEQLGPPEQRGPRGPRPNRP